MATLPLPAIEAANGVRTVFTFAADIDSNRMVLLDRFPQGEGIDFTVTASRQVTFTVAPVASALIWLLNGFTAGTAITTGLPTWGTVAEIVSDAAIELGLVPAAIVDPYASTDPNILQLCALLKSAGRAVLREREWTFLQREFTFSTAAAQAVYPLPSDFRSMIAQSGWDRTSLYELGGPIGAETWQYTKAVHNFASIYPFIRFQGGQLSITPTPASVQTIAFEYISWFWIQPAGATAPSASAPTVATDTVCFNEDLVVRALKLAWKKAKYLDTSAEQDDYDRALESEKNADAAAPAIYFGGGRDRSPAQDVWGNIPQTGIG